MLSLMDYNKSKDDSLPITERKSLLKSANSKLAKAYQLDPKNSLCCTQLSLRMIERDESKKAIIMASSALLHTKSTLLKAQAFLTKGRIAHSQVHVVASPPSKLLPLPITQGNFQGAYDNYKLAADNDPNSAVVQFYLALSLIQKGILIIIYPLDSSYSFYLCRETRRGNQVLREVLSQHSHGYDSLKVRFIFDIPLY